MKQMDVKRERTLGGNKYFVRPFGAFTSARLGGDVMHFVMPFIGSFATLAKGTRSTDSLLDVDIASVIPNLTNSISGDKLESILKKLLVSHNNISVEIEGEAMAKPLTEDLANELFCGETQDMFILAWEVVAANFGGFFGKLAGPSGKLNLEKILEMAEASFKNMGN